MAEANEATDMTVNSMPKPEEHDAIKTECTQKIELHAEFASFLELRSAIERYQKEKSVQLIVKDSKLLKAESTRKIIPKVYHLVNQSLMYHSITYCCKCHGELKQKPGTRVKNVGQKRLNCQMYIRFKLSPDLQKLVLFDLDETHNHGIDPTTCQMTPRQQVYRLSRIRQSGMSVDDDDDESSVNVKGPAAYVKNHRDDSLYPPPRKSARIQAKREGSSHDEDNDENGHDSDSSLSENEQNSNNDTSPLDSESSCSDSDEEERRMNRALLPFPIRLIGSAVQSSPELLAATKQLIQIQKSKLLIEKQKLILETKQLELMNTKLELEVRVLERNLAAEMAGTSDRKDTTIYLQAS
ncbi:unnamed protein product [Candidula unifasciata]|uniref:ZSWIM3 N-terminal domain-containing protein n=1 Tax=Candidula unifasciata TaxID=100452 RepID=A0A8S3YQV0_9EUPU|nr:unnamed protein product [Candidula unifasciata]